MTRLPSADHELTCVTVRLLALLLLALLLAGTPALAAETVRVGILSFRPAELAIDEWRPFQAALAEALPGKTVEIELLDYPALESAVASRRIDFVLTNSGHYILLLRRYGLSAPLATRIALYDEQPIEVFGGAIVVRADQPAVRELADLRNARIGYVARDSMGGFQMQAYELKDAGLWPLSTQQLFELGTPHDRVVEAVLSGEVDAGFVRAGLVESLIREGRLDPDALRIINAQDLPGLPFAVSTRLYPEWPLAAMPHADPDLTRRVAARVLALKDEPERLPGQGFGGFTVPADYSVLEDMLRALRVEPFHHVPTVTWRDVWHQYRLETLVAGAVIVLVLMLLVLLLINTRRQQTLLSQVEELNTIIARSPVVALAWQNQPGWPLRFVSESISRFGYSVEDFLYGATRYADLIHPDDLERVEGEIAVYIADGPDQYLQEYRLRHAEGYWIWVMDYTWLTRDRNAQVVSIHGVLMDVSDRKRAEAEAEHGRDLMRYIIENSREAVAVHDRDLRYLYVSQKYLEVFGKTGEDVIGRHHYEVFPDLPQRWREVHQRALAGEVISAEDDPFPRADGGLDWTCWSCRPWFDADGAIGGIIVYTEIVTQRKQIELDLLEKTKALAESNVRLEQLATVFTHAREGIIIASAEREILEVNTAFSRITGYSRDEVLGRNPRFLGSGRHAPEFFSKLWWTVEKQGYWSGEVWNRRRNGEIYPQKLTISSVCDQDGQIVQYLALLTDATTEKRHERQLEYISRHDALTGLPNRALLTERLKMAMADCRRHERKLAVALLDLDDFRLVNEHHGSAVGDRVLCELAQRLQADLRITDTVARLGGDELVVLLADGDADADADADAQFAEQLQALLQLSQQPFDVGGIALKLSASLGVSIYPQNDEVDADQLLRQADQAMYQAKLAGKGRVHWFDPERDQAQRGLNEMLNRIEAGLDQGEFVLHYQPKVNMSTGEVLGAEALIRWQHPERGLLPPAQFLPLIEGQPLALKLGAWVLETALAQVSVWNKDDIRLAVSINVSAAQLLEPDFIGQLKAALARHPGVTPAQLELEVLETSALEDFARISRLIEQCQALGVRCSLDDFGTGYSSLTYLRRLPASILKIDQSFVRDMLDDPEDLAILNGILGLSRAFQREVIAEGVETIEHGALLLDLGCQMGQGYGIARPMPAEDLPGWLKRWTPSPLWKGRQEKTPAQIAALFATVEHRAWVVRLAAYVQGLTRRPSDLDAQHCGFGEWLRDNLAVLDSLPDEADALIRAHDRAHALADRLVLLKDAGNDVQAREALVELYAARDQLVEALGSVIAALGREAHAATPQA